MHLITRADILTVLGLLDKNIMSDDVQSENVFLHFNIKWIIVWYNTEMGFLQSNP